MKERYLLPLCIFVFILQTTIFQSFRIFGVLPNLSVIVIILLTALLNRWIGIRGAIYLGILQDLFVSPALGLHTSVYVIIAVVISIFEDQVFRDNVIAVIMMIVASTLMYHSLFWIISYFMDMQIPLKDLIFKVLFIEGFYNLLLGFPLYHMLFKRLNGYNLR